MQLHYQSFIVQSLTAMISFSHIYQQQNNTIIYPKGHDIKSLLINLATTLLFFLPFALYYDIQQQQSENVTLYCAVVAGGLLVAVITPPVGWMRPHPYSDMEGNVPFKFRRD